MSGTPSLDDPRVLRELRAYQEALEAGGHPDRAALLALFPEIADDLGACLDGMDFVHRIAPQFGSEEAPDVRTATPLGDYRIAREIGRGGMGVVYEAEQMSLGRRVALKVLPFAAVLDSRYLRRFKNEAQAAAHLHHTNIVPVYAVGCERGVHYYAMQLIDGSTLADLVDELRELAGRGPEVDSSPALAAVAKERTTESPEFCRAVAHLGIQAAGALHYAHESGVVHRDIKPANLIVDAGGHLWITDFGLASTRNDTGLTMTGDLVGTLRYMSPEQAMAKRVAVDHRTDIYSLAVTLYELLTLRQAFPGDDPRAVMQAIALRQPARLRALNPAAPAELETILQKAMEKDPGDRFATAQELADDLHRFLDDRPIHARRPSLARRAAHWARRHRSVVWAAAAVLALAVIGLAAGLTLLARAHERERAAHLEADANFERAERNFRKAQDLVDRWLTRVADELVDQPHMEQVRKELLEEALTFYLGFLEERGDDPSIRHEAALAYRRVGQIRSWLGQDKESEESLQRAIALFEELARDSPRDRWPLASCLDELGLVHQRAGRLEEAERARRRALDLWEAVCASSSDPDAQQNLAICLRTLGFVVNALGRPREAEDRYRRACAIMETLVSGYPGTRPYRKDLARSYHNLGEILLVQHRFKEAEDLLRRKVATLEEIAAEDRAPNVRDSLAWGWQALGNVFLEAWRFDEAQHAFLEARSVAEELAREYPSVPEYRDSLGIMHLTLGLLYSRMATQANLPRLEEAERANRDAMAIFGELADEYPEVPGYRLHLACAHSQLGTNATNAADHERATEEHRQEIGILEGLADDLGSQREYRMRHALACHNFASALVNLGRAGEAEEPMRAAIAEQESLARDYADQPSALRFLAVWSSELAYFVLRPSERYADAESTFDEAVRIQSGLVAKYPDDPSLRGTLALCCRRYATFRFELGQPAKAVDELRNALEATPDDVSLLNEIAWYLATIPAIANAGEAVELAERAVTLDAEAPSLWNTLGVAKYRAGDCEGAVRALARSIDLGGGCVEDWLFLAMARWRLGDADAAREAYATGVELIRSQDGSVELEGFRAEAEALLDSAD